MMWGLMSSDVGLTLLGTTGALMMLGSMSSDVGLTLLGTTGVLDDVGLNVRCRADIIKDNGPP